jgi:uncharacterized Zn finger protein (UPF0148 family)
VLEDIGGVCGVCGTPLVEHAYTCPACGLNFPAGANHREEKCRALMREGLAEYEQILAASIEESLSPLMRRCLLGMLRARMAQVG